MNKKVKMVSFFMLIALLSSFTSIPKAEPKQVENSSEFGTGGTDSTVLEPTIKIFAPEDFSLSKSFTPYVSLDNDRVSAPNRQENPMPKWERIITEAFTTLGVASDISWQQKDDYYYSASVYDYKIDQHYLGMTISTRSSMEMWYCDTCPSSNYDPHIEEINFHSQKAQLFRVYREPYGLELVHLDWEMDGLYYSVTFSAVSFKGDVDTLYPAADAFYYAAGGTGSSSTVPSQPDNIPSEPENDPSEPEIDEPQNNPSPNDLCAAVACQPDHCSNDGTTLYYDCTCDNSDGKCYCWTDECDYGCDMATASCNAEPAGGLCANVNCGGDHCGEDGVTRYYECECDPADGECYCWSETCANGCDIASGTCIGQDTETDLCDGKNCPEKSCSEDLMTLNYGCACNSQTGECDCKTEACAHGCDAQSLACKADPCESVTCEDKCENNISSTNGNCDPVSGECVYNQVENCKLGCDPDTNTCITDLCANVECPDKCENNSSMLDGTCNPDNGQCVYADTTDCGLAGCEENTAFCKRLYDLSVKDVTVLQAVEGATLVARKQTAVAVEFGWENEVRDAKASVTLFIDGVPYSTIQKNVKAEKALSRTEKEYGRNLAVFHLPANYIQSGAHKFLVEAVLMDEDLVDGDLSNNSRTAHGDFVTTRGISLMFAAHPDVSEAQIWKFIKKAKPFMMNVFPVTSVTIRTPFYYGLSSSGSKGDQIAELMELHKIHNSNVSQYAGFSVGLFKDYKFGNDVNGFSFWWASHSVMVGDGSKNTKAHEALPHEIAGQWLDDEYTSSSDGINLPSNIYVYDAHTRTVEDLRNSISGKINLMGLAGDSSRLWINKDTWNALIPHFGGSTTGYYVSSPVLAAPLSQESGSGPGFIISGTISSEDQVTIKTLLPFDILSYESEAEGEYWVQVMDGRGSLDGEYPLPVDVLNDEASDGGYFVVTVPAEINSTSQLRIMHNDQVIWESNASASAPTVSIEMPSGNEPLSGSLDIYWTAEDPDGDDLSYTLQYSTDNGQTWVPVAVQLRKTQYTLDLDRIPGGSQCLLRVIASDGWHAAQADTPSAFAVADKPAQLTIDSPEEGAQFNYRDTIDLSAFAYDVEAGWFEGENIIWTSSVDGELGQGDSISFDDLSTGEHILTASLTTASGETLQKSVTITIAEPKSAGMSDKALFSIMTGVILLLIGGAVFLLITMKRKGKKLFMILAIVLIVGLLVLLGIALITLIDELTTVRPSYRRITTPTVEQVQQPMFEIQEQAAEAGETDMVDEAEPASGDGEAKIPSRNPGYAVNYNGIYFVGQVGNSASAETIPSALDDPFSPLPEHDRFLIEGYSSRNTMIEPVIRIIPLDALRAASVENAEEIALLQSLLNDPPLGIPDELPMLPTIHAGSLGAAHFSVLDFTSGSGVRYITQYAQNAWPVNNEGLFYTFQGITGDNAYYVSVQLPLAHDALNEYDDFQPPDDFYDTAAGLIGGQFLSLDRVDASSFTPSIVLLDQLVQSITITPTEAVG